MPELTKRLYFGGRQPVRRWRKWKAIADRDFRGSMSALFRDAVSKQYGLDPETGDPVLDKIKNVADKPEKSKKNNELL